MVLQVAHRVVQFFRREATELGAIVDFALRQPELGARLGAAAARRVGSEKFLQASVIA